MLLYSPPPSPTKYKENRNTAPAPTSCRLYISSEVTRDAVEAAYVFRQSEHRTHPKNRIIPLLFIFKGKKNKLSSLSHLKLFFFKTKHGIRNIYLSPLSVLEKQNRSYARGRLSRGRQTCSGIRNIYLSSLSVLAKQNTRYARRRISGSRQPCAALYREQK